MWPFFLSIRYFLAKRKEGMISLIGTISVIGVSLGVAALIIVLSVMNGFDEEIRDKIVGTYAHMMVTADGGIADSGQLIRKVEDVPGVDSASSFIAGQAILKSGDTISGILLKGVDIAGESEVSDIVRYTGGAGKRLDKDSIILGVELMKNEGISLGDTVELIVPYSLVDQEKNRLKVIGIFESGRYDYDANMAIVDLEAAGKVFRTKGAVTGIGIRVDDEMKVGELRDRLQRYLKYPYIVKTWMDLDRNLVKALALEKKMMFLILALIITVACFNISGSLIMMVMEKTRDIGILRAIGASRAGVSMVFLLEGLVIGVIGVLAGAVAGTFIAYRVNEAAGFIKRVTGMDLFPSDVYYFTEIPVRVCASDITAIVSVAMVLTLLAGIYPAWKASRMDPVDAIRYE